MKTADRLSTALARVHAGQTWYGPSRAKILEDVTWEEAAWRPAPSAHSIWALVLHMRSWTFEVTRRLGGAVPAAPADGDWPAPPSLSAATWSDTLSSLERAHEELARMVQSMDEEALASKVRERPGDPPGAAISRRAMVGSLAEHDIYHSGQVAMLKRLARSLR